KLDEAVAVGGGESAPLELVEQLARAQEQAGRGQQALTTWESVRGRDFHYPAAAEKLESLRNVVDVERETRATLEAGGGAAAEDSRYEILGEGGRGGVGGVLQAREQGVAPP